MADALVDTSIIIDLLRGYEPAQRWFITQRELSVSRVVWLEVIEGAPNRVAQRTALRLLQRFPLEEVVTADIVWATEQLILMNLSHNIDAFDCIIAGTCQRLQIPLFTRNLKHFTPLIGPLAQQPY
jgi:predicted nucleic acid-binding protein